MKHIFNKRCWYCGSTDMEKKEGYSQCRECQATWTPIPHVSQDPITLRVDPMLSRSGTSNVKSPSPSGAALRKAKKAREAAA